MRKNRIGIAAIFIFFAAIIIGGQLTAARIEAANKKAAVTYTIGYLPITHALPVFEEKELLEAVRSGLSLTRGAAARKRSGGKESRAKKKKEEWTHEKEAFDCGGLSE